MQFDNHGGNDLLSDLWQIKSESRYQTSQNYNGNFNLGLNFNSALNYNIPTTYRSNSVGSNGIHDIWSNDLTKISSNNSNTSDVANLMPNYNYTQSVSYSPTYSPNYSPISLSSTNLTNLPNLVTAVEKNEETASNASDDKKPINTQLYKTELCDSFIKTNYCPYGNKCQFAHGQNELKFVKRPNNYRSKDCVNWKNFGTCRYGNRCCFKHE